MKIFLLVIGLLCPFQAAAESLYLASNVAADVYVNGEKAGKTPMQLEYSGEEIALKKDGYNTAVLTKPYLMQGRSAGGSSIDTGITDESASWVSWGAVAVETTAGAIGYVVGGAVGLTVGLAVPFAIPPVLDKVYADNHHFITLFPENATQQETLYALKQMEARHLVLASFDRQFQPEYIKALSIQARLPESTVKRLLRENPTPDGAANAVAAAMKK